jgi:ClpP class serine protease
MNIDRLASYIMRSMWLMDPRAVSALVPFINSYLNGERTSFMGGAEENPYLGATYFDASGRQVRIEREAVANNNIFSNAPTGSIAVIPVHGTILHDDGACGEVGTRTISSWVRDALSVDNISGIMYHVNSPGGMVNGTGDFGRLIKLGSQHKTSKTICDGLMASAGYWIGCSTDEVYASFETVEIGCIGTMMSFMDNRERLEQMGIKLLSYYADSSPEKNLDFTQARDGNADGLKVNLLNPTNDVFLKTVKANRGDKLKLTEVKIDGKTYFEPLTGKIYLAESAVSMGLIDGIKSFEETIDSTAESAFNGGSKNANHQKLFNMSLFNKNPKLTSAAAKARNGEAITTAELEEVNTELNAAGDTGLIVLEQSAVQKLENELEAANNAKATAETSLTAITKERDDWKQKAETYGAQGGDVVTTLKKKENAAEAQHGDGNASTDPWNNPSLEFNQILDRSRTASRTKI